MGTEMTLAGKRRQKIVKIVAALKIDGCMHPSPQIEGPCTNSNNRSDDLLDGSQTEQAIIESTLQKFHL